MSFNAPHPEEFDTAYMRALFDVGHSEAVKGYQWSKVPVGMPTPHVERIPSQAEEAQTASGRGRAACTRTRRIC